MFYGSHDQELNQKPENPLTLQPNSSIKHGILSFLHIFFFFNYYSSGLALRLRDGGVIVFGRGSGHYITLLPRSAHSHTGTSVTH